jgi:hypothetical protein
MAAGGAVCLLMVAATSVRLARRRLRYETWHFVHLYAYLAIALSFGHELAVGNDLAEDPVARIYWIALYAAVVACVLGFRVGHPLRLAVRHRLRVAQVVPAPSYAACAVTADRRALWTDGCEALLAKTRWADDVSSTTRTSPFARAVMSPTAGTDAGWLAHREPHHHTRLRPAAGLLGWRRSQTPLTQPVIQVLIRRAATVFLTSTLIGELIVSV